MSIWQRITALFTPFFQDSYRKKVSVSILAEGGRFELPLQIAPD